MMQVFKARWYGTLVALKVLVRDNAAVAAALQHEANVLEGIRHPHIVNYLDYIIGEHGTVSS
jgi:serine/threonine protein kinase